MSTPPLLPEVVAETLLDGIDAIGKRFRIRAWIGRPYLDKRCWKCPCGLEGLHGRFPDICGEDSMQAIGLAMSLLSTLLRGKIAGGTRIVFADTDVDPGCPLGPGLIIGETPNQS